MLNYFLLNIPNPPGRNIYRAFAGGFGTLGSVYGDTLIPQYLLYAASALENQNQNYDVMDGQAPNYTIKDILSEVKKSSPDVLIAWLSLPSLAHDIHILDELKTALPETIVFGCGTVCKVLPEEILKKSKIDALITGNYPYYNSISSLAVSLNNGFTNDLKDVPGIILKKNGKIIKGPKVNERENLDKLNLGVYHKFPVERYVADYLDRNYNKISCIPILTGVGCSYSCSYCPYPLGYGRKILTKSIENIIKEIEFLMNNYGVNGFVFREQAFTHNRERTLKFCNEIIKKELKIKWLIETRFDNTDIELLKDMKGAGCFRIHYGVETGDEALLKSKGKPGTKVKQIKKAFSETKAVGISTHAHVIVGFPDETEESVEDTVKLLKKINPDHVNVNIATPYPGTKLYKEALKKKYLLKTNWSDYTSCTPLIKTERFSPEMIEKARKKIKREFLKFKLKNDGQFRKNFVFKLPFKIKNRLLVLMNKGSR